MGGIAIAQQQLAQGHIILHGHDKGDTRFVEPLKIGQHRFGVAATAAVETDFIKGQHGILGALLVIRYWLLVCFI